MHGDLKALSLKPQPFNVEDILKKIKIIANDGFEGDIDNKGHGLQRSLIFALLKTYADTMNEKDELDKSFIFLIEEPEIYLHPHLQRKMYQVLRKISEGKDQVIYSTHSSLFIDIENFDDICRVKKQEDGENYKTTIMQLSMGDLIEDLKKRYPNTNPTDKSMRERYSHVYNTQRNEGFLQIK